MTKMPVFLDLETFAFSPGNMAPRPVVASWAFPDGQQGLMHMGEQAWWDEIEDWIVRASEGEIVLVGHHLSYDMACLFANAKDPLRIGRKIFAAYEAGGVEDAQVRQQLLDIKDGAYRGFWHDVAGPHKISYHLADLVPRLLGRELPKPHDLRTSYGDLYGLGMASWPKEARDYAQDDAVAVRDVWRAQEDLAAKTPGCLEDQHRQARASFALQLCANWGPVCDPAAVDALEAAAKRKCMDLLVELRRAGLVRSNGTKNMAAAQNAMATACYAAGIEPRRSGSGGISVDADACEAVPQSEALQAWSEYIRQQNILSKNIPTLREGCGRPIHTYFDTLVQSGRISSAKPNITNINREGGFRECFVPRSGMLYAASDFGKAELHSLAEVCFQLFGYSTLGETLNGGIDPHLRLAAGMLKISYDEALRRKGEPVIKEARQSSKASSFGWPGGLGVEHFRQFAKTDYGVEMSEDEAEQAKALYFETYPEVREYLDWVARAVGQSETTITQLFSGRVRGGCGYTDGANTLFQGLTADYAKAAMWNATKEMYTDTSSVLYGSRLVNMIHDELLAEVPDDADIADAAARRLAAVMEESAAPWTPHFPVKAEPVLMRCWSKKAETAFDSQGRLVPWEKK